MGVQNVAGTLKKGEWKMRSGKIWLGLALMAFWTGGCDKPAPTTAVVSNDIHDGLLVVNGLANTLSLFHIGTREFTETLAVTGNIPNEVHVRGRNIYVVNSGSNNIQVCSGDNFTGASVFIDTGVGCNPWSLVFQDDNTAYCSCLQTNELLKVDLAAKIVSARKTIPAASGKYPEGLAIANGKLYTAMTASTGCSALYSCGDGTNVAVLDLSDFAGNSFTGVTMDTPDPQALALDASNRVHVVCTGDYSTIWGKVNVIDPTTDTVVGSVTGLTNYSPGLIDIAPNGKGFLAAWGGAFAYDAAALGTVTVMDSTSSHGYLGVSHAHGMVYFSDFPNDKIREYDATTLALTDTLRVGDGPGSSVFMP
jgi:DNA-binding beta-propeller fold protein YncE